MLDFKSAAESIDSVLLILSQVFNLSIYSELQGCYYIDGSFWEQDSCDEESESDADISSDDA
ncbi:NS7b protein [Common moorhen coronavirus HKU21]|uniref:NS7b protein n=1 Tax=Common moorhen coronavirus HKU21 TaxID=1159902 RepID=H9BR41_9NIDO|nr:NS7b protein [Common moorhen coronavirus HKU21]AFD29250.1 NS7b protein [Common moorhen coronavirus HKU21]